MKIQRRFTRKGKGPYQGIAFEERTSEIRDPDGKVIFHQDGVVVPRAWSQIATDILAQKYFRKTGVPAKDGSLGGETDARQVFHRLAHTWTDWGRRYGYFSSEEDAESFYGEISCMLARQMAAPNSPQWFNTGLFAVYGIKGPAQGHHYVEPESGELKTASSAYERPQPHACQPYHAPVSTPLGPVPIGEIVERGLTGLEIYDGSDGGRGTTRVIAVAENGVKPVLRIVLKNGAAVEATADHLVFASSERRSQGQWLPVEQLEPGMYLRLSTATGTRDPLETTDHIVDEAALVGWLHGDGFVGQYTNSRSRSLTLESGPSLREEPIARIEFLGLMKVFDIQTESGQYLSNNVLVHNCFIISVQDDLVGEGGIMAAVTSEARLFKYGSGTGSNYSRLRAKREPLSGGGISSGLLSFLKVGDRSASAIKSGGTTRRAARMVTLDADHPDIEEYVDWKVDEEQKVVSMVVGSRILRRHTRQLEQAVAAYAGNNGSPEAAALDPEANPQLREAIRDALAEEIPPTYLYRILQLLGQGYRELEVKEYTTDWDEDAYATVSGQSSNNSVRLSAEFMGRVVEDGDWTLSGRVDQGLKISMKARSLWDRIAYAAWNCADPGIQYHSTINEWHTCPEDGEIRASNPCSEYMFLDDTACNLASLNLMAFYDAEAGSFDVQGFAHAIELWTIVLEISVLMAQFPSASIARKSYDYRTLGLGYANLGSLLMVMGVPYDSEEGRAVAAALSAILTGEAYATSARMAAELGPFPRFPANREAMLRVIRNHRRAILGAPEEEYEDLSVYPRRFADESCPPELAGAARGAWDRALELGEKHGFRNAQVSAIAPTGTIGLVMDCDTTGVEPDFALVKFKKLAGGGSFKIINASIPPALKRLGYTPEQVEEITAYCVGRKTLKGAPGVSWEALEAKGFDRAALQRVDRALENAFSLHGGFLPA
ncbi:MAG: adenosylcobalamin-dependent ribonucleoside-diphosphate reductase, partial [Spirochaetales bacterium]|nr:adenosylcobalamin-dependent ribonucleoside-diphosphate reductase [Spirochaetales bacterium]